MSTYRQSTRNIRAPVGVLKECLRINPEKHKKSPVYAGLFHSLSFTFTKS